MSTRQHHHKQPHSCERAVHFAIAYTLVVCGTVVAIAYICALFFDRAAIAVHFLPSILASVAALIRMAHGK
jgi:hypothetical protein